MLQATSFILGQINSVPKLAIVLGSGLGDMAECVQDKLEIRYDDIPGFLRSTVPGHAGKLVIGKLAGVDVMLLCGRFHHYEGYSHRDIVLPVRVIKELGVEYLLLTNAAGGVNLSFRPGDLMLIEDHINFSGDNPLIGPNEDAFGPRFPDMSHAYDPHLSKIIENAAKEACIPLKKGVYILFNGPSFETPAEIRMCRILGADAVGMSTVPEVIAANHSGLKVAAISCITNMAAGILNQPLSHSEVIETGEKVKGKFSCLVTKIIENIAKE
jgi:purine-nucleoside phosphorylase